MTDGQTDRQTDGHNIYRAIMASLGVSVSSDISQGSAASRLRWAAISSDDSVTTFLPSLSW